MRNSDLIESTYKKVTQLEHILIRPDTYIGSIEKDSQSLWVFDESTKNFVNKNVSIVPGLFKIFDEILVNAADNKQRDPKMNEIRINIDTDNNEISVWNNGKGLPIVIHKTEQKYVPTMIFGTLLTSSNYNDNQKKVTGGRNGYGAKLCNIFSSKFTVETSSNDDKKTFKQTWYDNMNKSTDPIIEKMEKKSQDYTCVTFKPDFSKFNMRGLDDDIVSIFKRRAYDIAASCRGVKVILNDEALPINNLKDYAKMYLEKVEGPTGGSAADTMIYEKVNDRWEIAFAVSDSGFNQVSFVNSIATTNGGSHVNHVADSIVKGVMTTINKKFKSKTQIKNHMWLFVNCLVENPSFSSQTKETMTLNQTHFGSKCDLSDKFFKDIAKIGFIESVIQFMKMKDESKLAKQMTSSKTNKLRDVPKLDDANYAGTSKSSKCTLMLTEGDSAKSMAVSGFGIIGRDYFGVFPLRGKVLNVRDAATSKISDNAEVGNIIKILGLNYKRKYDTEEDLKTLRYGKLMVMTDQDPDGSHIKGLLINMFEKFWPNLLKGEFMQEFITPIIKVKKGNQSLSFFSLPDFENWKSNTENWHTWRVKYYKGLGTSTSDEAKEYFGDFEKHRIYFEHEGQQDNDSIDMAFNSKRVEDRKRWLTTWMERLAEDASISQGVYSSSELTSKLSYSDFINKELILFSYYDLQRSIPSVMDGLKPGQRKVIYACLKMGIIGERREKKVSQLGGSVSSESAYHHGEASLVNTIVNLAQNFVGSNNINLLNPNGQFGTRIHGGTDCASARYIYTSLTPLIKLIFHPDDTPLLKNNFDDNMKVEPIFYVPVIPVALVNGADGIGTGWSTKVPNFSPYEIISNLRRMINKQEPSQMHPYYKNFTGTIIPEDESHSKYAVFGECADLGNNMVEISELPIKTWTQNYKENKMEVLLHGDAKKKLPSKILDYSEHHSDTTVKFVVKMIPDEMEKCLKRNQLHKFFGLQSSISMRNCVLFDSKGRLKTFGNAVEILKEFFVVRMELYQARKAYMENGLLAEAKFISNQARFITDVINRKIIIEKKSKRRILEELIANKYDPNPIEAWKKSLKIDEESEKQVQDDAQEEEGLEETQHKESDDEIRKSSDYNYLLSMQLWSLTKERIESLNKLKDEKKKEYDTLVNTSAEKIYLNDLEKLETELRALEAKERQQELEAISKGSKIAQKKGKLLQKQSARLQKQSKSSMSTFSNQALAMKDPNGIRIVPIIDPSTIKAPKNKAEKPPNSTKSDDSKKVMNGTSEKKTNSTALKETNSSNQSKKSFSDRLKVLKDNSNEGESKKVKFGDEIVQTNSTVKKLVSSDEDISPTKNSETKPKKVANKKPNKNESLSILSSSSDEIEESSESESFEISEESD